MANACVCACMFEVVINSVVCFIIFSCCFSHGALIGFTNIGDVNTYIAAFEQSLKETHISWRSISMFPPPPPLLHIEGFKGKCEDRLADSLLVLMVNGLLSSLEFPYVQFQCSELAGKQLYTLFWGAVAHLERCGFHVMACTCVGLAAN